MAKVIANERLIGRNDKRERADRPNLGDLADD
jgi:hypothetical protein